MDQGNLHTNLDLTSEEVLTTIRLTLKIVNDINQ